jgi:hypothetical protein
MSYMDDIDMDFGDMPMGDASHSQEEVCKHSLFPRGLFALCLAPNALR